MSCLSAVDFSIVAISISSLYQREDSGEDGLSDLEAGLGVPIRSQG